MGLGCVCVVVCVLDWGWGVTLGVCVLDWGCGCAHWLLVCDVVSGKRVMDAFKKCVVAIVDVIAQFRLKVSDYALIQR